MFAAPEDTPETPGAATSTVSDSPGVTLNDPLAVPPRPGVAGAVAPSLAAPVPPSAPAALTCTEQIPAGTTTE